MLVLTRKPNESVAIDLVDRPELGTCHVTVNQVSGDRVRLGFDAAQCWRFLRTEIDRPAVPSPDVAELLFRHARLLRAEMAGRHDQDRTILEDASSRLTALAIDQES